MALTSRSLFLYGFQITTLNQNLDFRAVVSGPVLTAVLDLGFYSATSLLEQIAIAMQNADPANVYTASIDRTVMGGLQNRMEISTSGSYLDLLFLSGPTFFSSIYPVIGFNPADYTGATAYIGSSTTGSTILTDQIGYSYSSDKHQGKVFGAVNVAASGLKESVVFAIQKFINIEFKYEPASKLLEWVNFFTWAIQQRPFDFTPEITLPETAYQVTLEKTPYDGKGLGFKMTEMLPQFPNHYQTGALEFRIIVEGSQFTPPA